MGFIQVADPKVLDRRAAQFWFTSLIISSLTNLYKLQLNSAKQVKAQRDLARESNNATFKADFHKLEA